MKNVFFLLFFFGVTNMFAQQNDPEPDGTDITLTVGYTDTNPIITPTGRTQMRRPAINITGNKITVPELLLGCEMSIISNGITVYTEVVSSTEIFVPENLSGTFEIQFVNNIYCFTGEIDL